MQYLLTANHHDCAVPLSNHCCQRTACLETDSSTPVNSCNPPCDKSFIYQATSR